ncbi:MAG: lipopolysaccharide biosynthesis protein [Muribaculaceae bacterium]|nr:lipopolysaccharide biosynthesis protein [Muribaculaceae bacterium]
MAGLTSLFKDTVVYGISSILGRFLNWCLVPLYTYTFAPAENGIITMMYAVVAFLIVALTYGMETGFFRFANRWPQPMAVYSTALISLMCTSTAFVLLVLCFLQPVTLWMGCAGHPEYVMIMAVCVAMDAFVSLPFAYLRYTKRPIRFATVKMINIGFNIGFNLFFLCLCPLLAHHMPYTVNWFYDPQFGVGYIFLANLLATFSMFILLLPELRGFRWTFDGALLRRMLRYSVPLLVLGLAGIMNSTVDKIIYRFLVPGPEGEAQLGIYGACFKIAVVMVMFTQAFRFAYEPFIFARARECKDPAANKRTYSDAMKYSYLLSLFIFLTVMYYLNIIKYFVAPAYFAGLVVVPVVLVAELGAGVYYNLTVWYKLTDRTHWGIWFTLIGLAVTLALNIILVPQIGYMGCAIAAAASAGAMVLSCYMVGRHYFPIDYQLPRLGVYTLVAGALYVLGLYILVTDSEWLNYAIRTGLLLLFLIFALRLEHFPLPHRRQPAG